ncbi:MAG: hypothetical protein ACR2QO_08020 [Acidimicrobiales bacterium]
MSTKPEPRRLSGSVAMLAALALLGTACSGSEADASTEVATLESAESESVESDADVAAATADPDDAALAFSACMREEGIDFPDLSVDAEGNIELREAFQSVDRNVDGFRDAMDACNSLLGETAFGGRGAALESPEVQDGLLAFSDCVREAGYDVGDLTLGGAPGGQGGGQEGGDVEGADGAGDEDRPGGGERQQGFGNRNARFADQLGLDYEDPDVMTAIDGCAPIIEDAFANAGIGQPGGGPAAPEGD